MPNSTPVVTQHSNELRRWAVVLVAALLLFYNYIQLSMFSSLSRELMTTFELNATQFSSLSAKYFLGSLILFLPAGLLLDRISTRTILLGTMILCLVSIFGFSWAHHTDTLAIMRFLSGVAGAFAFLACMRLTACWFPPKKLALAIGSMFALAMLGGIVAHSPFMLAEHLLGWRYAIVVFGILGIVILFVMWMTIQDWPPECSQQDACITRKTAVTKVGLWNGFRVVAFNIYNWLCGIYAALMTLPICVLGALWGTNYLMHAHSLSESAAVFVNSMIFLGLLVGSPLTGWISDTIKRRILPMIIGATISLLIILIVVYASHLSLFALVVLFFLLGLASSTQVLSYTVMTELNSPLISSAALGLVSLIMILGGAVSQYVFGRLLDLHWTFNIVNGEPMYAASDFKTAMMILPFAFFLSILAAYFIKETKCRPQTDQPFLPSTK